MRTRSIILVAAVVLLAAFTVKAEVTFVSEHSMLFSQFVELKTIDSLVLGLTDDAVVACRFDPSISLLVPEEYLLLPGSCQSMKQFGEVLAVKADETRLVFVDLANLPSLSLLGEIDLDESFADYVVDSEFLYVAFWFDGLRRYQHHDYQTAQFVDSTMKPILISQVDRIGDTLYALDEYNGVFAWDISNGGFSHELGTLLVPTRPSGFVKFDSEFLLSLTVKGAFIGRFGMIGSGVTDSIPELPSTDRMFVTPSHFLCLQSRVLTMVERDDFDQRIPISIGDDLVSGDTLSFYGRRHLLLPGTRNAITAYDQYFIGQTRSLLERTGPVTSVSLGGELLIAAGETGPIDVYGLNADTPPSLLRSIDSSFSSVALMRHSGDALVVLDTAADSIVLFSHPADSVHGSTASLPLSFQRRVTDMRFHNPLIDSTGVALLMEDSSIHVFTVYNDSNFTRGPSWHFPEKIAHILAESCYLFVVSETNQLWLYRILPDLTLEFRSVLELPEEVHALAYSGSHLLAFSEFELILIEYSDSRFPEIESIMPIDDCVLETLRDGNLLYTSSPQGCSVYYLGWSVPQLLSSIPVGGNMIGALSDRVVVSDGGAVHLLRVEGLADTLTAPGERPTSYRLSQNYPNPFNLTTEIEYSLQSPSQVRLTIYNVLGQEVIRLIDEAQASGPYRVSWNARARNGRVVASGVYLYRLDAGDWQDSRKMVLLK